jgi:hypothetical protein
MATKILTYDIPSAINFPNPSNILRRRGVRFNLSCWILDEDRVPWSLVEDMKQAGIRKVYVVPGFDTNHEDAQRLMIDALTEDVRKQQERDLKALKRQDEALAAAEAEANGVWTRELDAARKKHAKDRKSTLKSTEKLLADLAYAMDLYKLNKNLVPFSSARQQIANIRALNGAQASYYTQMAAAAQGTPLAAAAAADDIPAGILADFVEENGNQTLANNARQAFAPTPAAPRSAPTARTATEYMVRRQNETIRVSSTLSTTEAATICRDLESDFARDLGRRYLQGRQRFSGLQVAWLHVLANEARQPAPAAIPAPAAAQVTTPPAPVVEPAAPPVAAPIVDDRLPGEGAPVPVISTEGMGYASGIFSVNASDANLGNLPREVDIRSHKTGKVVRFVRSHEDWAVDGDGSEELEATVYKSQDQKHTLRVVND